jgi:ABC-type Zn uptake system ZnuABC Zn-binding protein ZnuA
MNWQPLVLRLSRPALCLLLPAVLVAALVVAGCGTPPAAWADANAPHVVVTIPPLQSFVQNVAGKHAEVKCLCTEKGPHHYEYDVQDTLAFRDADLFFAIGLVLDEAFADKLAPHARRAQFRYVKLGERLPADLKLKSHDDDEDDKGHDKKDADHDKKDKDHDHKDKDAHGQAHGHDHEHGEIDPHVWLGIPQAKAMVEVIRDELKRVDPSHAADYDANAKKYAEALDTLLSDGRAQLKGKKNRKVISFHESLAYFAKSFDVDIADTIETGPGFEPGPGRLKRLVELCKKDDIRVLAVEPQYSKTTSAATLERELQGKLRPVEIDPLETATDAKDLKDPKWYEAKMRRNIQDLAGALP